MGIHRILVANRGEIAVRVIRACHVLGMETVLAASAADLESRAARCADHVMCIGPAISAQSYLAIDRVVGAALAVGADALHPGYGFLAEDAELAACCERQGIVFVGPCSEVIKLMGNKLRAREVAVAQGVPVIPGSEMVKDVADLRGVADELGLPLLVKAAAGGGGRGMRLVRERGDLEPAFQQAVAEAQSAFGDGTIYVERYFERARHVEVQILGDGLGKCISIGERDCSTQRRYQKLIEEAPSPGINDGARQGITKAAEALAESINYKGAGTVEFLWDESTGNYYFLEMNTRIQVEHPVTEMISGMDLVVEQLRIADKGALPRWSGELRGHSIELRVNAEDPRRGFLPKAGRIERWRPRIIDGVRYDTHCFPGYYVPVFYDSLLCKVIVHRGERESAIEVAREALAGLICEGVTTNRDFLIYVLDHEQFRQGRVFTGWIDEEIDAEWNSKA